LSHFTKMKTQIKNPDAFIAACQELGLNEILRNIETTDFYGKRLLCDVVVKVTSKYDLSLQKNGDAYDMVADFWGLRTGERNPFSTFPNDKAIQDRMLQLTTKHDVIQKARRQGLRVASTSEDEQGNVVLHLAG
jgi:hypothetical protein